MSKSKVMGKRALLGRLVELLAGARADEVRRRAEELLSEHQDLGAAYDRHYGTEVGAFDRFVRELGALRQGPRLNKTQQRVLREAQQSKRGWVCVHSYHGHGGDGGVVSHPNTRKHNAACQLRDMGLLSFVRHEHARDTKNGWTVHISDALYELTEAGKACELPPEVS